MTEILYGSQPPRPETKYVVRKLDNDRILTEAISFDRAREIYNDFNINAGRHVVEIASVKSYYPIGKEEIK